MDKKEQRTTKTIISPCIASSSGSRHCLVCEEKIQNRTIVVDFFTADQFGEVDRGSDQFVCHPDCALELHRQLRLILLETGHIKLGEE